MKFLRRWLRQKLKEVGLKHLAFTFDELLEALKPASPLQVVNLRQNYMKVEHGLLSVGIKLHTLSEQSGLMKFFEKLGGEHYLGGDRPYQHVLATSCLVLPPVGSATSAIQLLECLERATGTTIFNNPNIQIQVCSPGRLDAKRAAILSVAHHLGSDLLRRYDLEDLETTFSDNPRFPGLKRGRRIIIYDGRGELERTFHYWDVLENTLTDNWDNLLVRNELPFTHDRTDIITCQTKVDIQNVNLVASMLVHSQCLGYWVHVGNEFEEEIEMLLHEHLLDGCLDAPWIRTDDESTSDDGLFMAILNELTAYAFEEYARMQKPKRFFGHLRYVSPASDILSKMRAMLQKYRNKIIRRSRMLETGGEP